MLIFIGPNFILLSKPPFYESLIKTVVVNIRPEAEFLKDEDSDIFSFMSLSCSWNPACQRLARSVC